MGVAIPRRSEPNILPMSPSQVRRLRCQHADLLLGRTEPATHCLLAVGLGKGRVRDAGAGKSRRA